MLRQKTVQKDTTDEGNKYAKNSKPQFERAKNIVDPVLQKLLSQSHPNSLRVLDIGCGAGDIAAYIASLGINVDALDVAAEMIEAAKVNYSLPNLHFLVADAADYNYPYKFDLILSTSALQWVSDDKIQHAFNLISQHLKADGELLFLVPTYDFPHIVIKDKVAFTSKWKAQFETYTEPQCLQRTASDYQTLLEKANLCNISLYEKKTSHEYTSEGFLGFTRQWCGCYYFLKDECMAKKFAEDVRKAFESYQDKEEKVTFEQTSLIGKACKPAPKLSNVLTLGFSNQQIHSQRFDNTQSTTSPAPK